MAPTIFAPLLKLLVKKTNHYEVEAILQSRQTKNRRGIQYLVNGRVTQIPTIPGNQLLTWKTPWTLSQLSTNDTLTFHNLQTLQEQYVLKEGMLFMNTEL